MLKVSTALLFTALLCAGCASHTASLAAKGPTRATGSPVPTSTPIVATASPTTSVWTDAALSQMLITDDDAPGFQVDEQSDDGDRAPSSTITLSATESLALDVCTPFYVAWTELDSDAVPGPHASAMLTGISADTKALDPTVHLRAYPSAEAAASKITAMKNGVSSCPKAKPLPGPGLGEDSTGFTEMYDTPATGGMALLAARVGSVVATVRVDTTGDLHPVTDLLHTLAAKQVAKLQSVPKG